MTATPSVSPMDATGHGTAYGAITVVNAIATGRGAAIGIDLATNATVQLEGEATDGGPLDLMCDVSIADEPDEDLRLAEAVVRTVLGARGIGGKIQARIVTTSTIPISRGLKSSSAAANALTLATLDALGVRVGDDADIGHDEVISLGVDAALAAGVTITGAYDDASASYRGGLVVTDNAHRTVVHAQALDNHEVLLVVPKRKVRTWDTATSPTHPLRPFVDEAWEEARQGAWQRAMLRNSLAYGATYGLDNRLTLSMLDTGAIAAGISGTGPAIAVVIRPNDWDCFTDIIHTLAPDADIIIAHTDRPQAHQGDPSAPLRPQVIHPTEAQT